MHLKLTTQFSIVSTVLAFIATCLTIACLFIFGSNALTISTMVLADAAFVWSLFTLTDQIKEDKNKNKK